MRSPASFLPQSNLLTLKPTDTLVYYEYVMSSLGSNIKHLSLADGTILVVVGAFGSRAWLEEVG